MNARIMVAIFLQIVKQLLIYPKEKLSTIHNYSLEMYDLKVLQYRERAGGKFLRFCSPISHFILTIFYEWSGLVSGVWR